MTADTGQQPGRAASERQAQARQADIQDTAAAEEREAERARKAEDKRQKDAAKAAQRLIEEEQEQREAARDERVKADEEALEQRQEELERVKENNLKPEAAQETLPAHAHLANQDATHEQAVAALRQQRLAALPMAHGVVNNPSGGVSGVVELSEGGGQRRVDCPGCGNSWPYSLQIAGTTIPCNRCGYEVSVPLA